MDLQKKDSVESLQRSFSKARKGQKKVKFGYFGTFWGAIFSKTV